MAAEDRPEHDHVGHARQPLERHGQHEPSRAGGLEEVAYLVESRRQKHDQAEHDEEARDGKRAACEVPGLELARHLERYLR